MARYIKVNPLVAEYLNLKDYRNKLKDGNYMLWQGDMTRFGPLPRLAETLARIGGIALAPYEAKEEQDGVTLRPLPVATDPQFVVAVSQETPAEPETPTGEEAETETPANGETEFPEEETPANGETTEETEESHEETQEAEGETGNDDNPNDTEE